VDGQAYLGIPENQLIFLGYPDGYIDKLYSITQEQMTNSSMQLTNGKPTTYGNRGLCHRYYHFYRFSSHAKYNSYNICRYGR
jgi:hypothetical protein